MTITKSIKTVQKSRLFYVTTPIFYVNAGTMFEIINFQIFPILLYFIPSFCLHNFQLLILGIYIRQVLLIAFIVMRNCVIVL